MMKKIVFWMKIKLRKTDRKCSCFCPTCRFFKECSIDESSLPVNSIASKIT